MMATTKESSGPRIIQWYVDTRRMWPVPKKEKPKDEVLEFKTVAARELALLTPEEQASVLKFYHLRDAKTKLVSHLLKHLIISTCLGIPWSSSHISHDTKKKPCFIFPGQTSPPLGFSFNVSHQAGLVCLIAAVGFKGRVEVGTDIVCDNERRKLDYAHIDKNGFFDWIDIHGDVFAPSELSFMKLGFVDVKVPVDGVSWTGFARDVVSRVEKRDQKVGVKVKGKNGEDIPIQLSTTPIIDAKIRRFYAMWCLREAYVKMSGDALLAPWLKELEILDISVPEFKAGIAEDDEFCLEQGETTRQFATYLKGKVERDVKTELSALGRHYMIGASVKVPREHEMGDVVFGEWKELDFERDVLEVAERG